MKPSSYFRYELLRTVRNRRFIMFSFGFPVLLYLLIAGPNKGEVDLGGTGVSAPLYFMVGLISFGTMTTMLSTGARISTERLTGWTRQLRISPLRPPTYFRTKIGTAYAMALCTIGLLYLCGIGLGVSMSGARWLEMTGLILIALMPFAALGVVMGHLINPDSAGPAIGGITAILAFLGGTWFPVPDSGFFHDVALAIPSYWVVQAGRVGIGGEAWGPTGWAVIAGWTLVLTALAVRVYRRDGARV